MLPGMARARALLAAPRPLPSLALALGSLFLAGASQPALADDARGKVTIYVVRHGETDWNLQGRIQGSTDNSLNAKGREQAAAIAAQLAQLSIDQISTSGLSRAIQTGVATPSPVRR